MTPEELKKICTENGGQAKVASLIPCDKDHLNRMCNKRLPISERFAAHVRLLFPKSF